jgi:hypothetical protein
MALQFRKKASSSVGHRPQGVPVACVPIRTEGLCGQVPCRPRSAHSHYRGTRVAVAPDEARRTALQARQKARNGEDPSADKKAAKAALSVGQLIDHYLADGPATKPAKRASTWVIDASNLNRRLRRLLGTKIANAVSKAEAARAIRDITDGKSEAEVRTRPRGRVRVRGGPGASRRTRNVAAAMFAWSMEHGLCASNPFVGISLTSAPVRERFLTKEEAG